MSSEAGPGPGRRKPGAPSAQEGWETSPLRMAVWTRQTLPLLPVLRGGNPGPVQEAPAPPCQDSCLSPWSSCPACLSWHPCLDQPPGPCAQVRSGRGPTLGAVGWMQGSVRAGGE